MSFWTIVGRLALAFVLGGVIGWEREYEEKPAGLRTFILVCLGAALFVLVTLELTEESRGLVRVGPVRVDPVRIIASVAQGVGFLGAGTILATRGSVLGLTTAAAIWATSAIVWARALANRPRRHGADLCYPSDPGAPDTPSRAPRRGKLLAAPPPGGGPSAAPDPTARPAPGLSPSVAQ